MKAAQHTSAWLENERAINWNTSLKTKQKQYFLTLFDLSFFLCFSFHNFMIFSWGWWCFKTGELAKDE